MIGGLINLRAHLSWLRGLMLGIVLGYLIGRFDLIELWT